MSSQGKGSEISPQDASDLLHKLMTEMTKVVAALHVTPRLTASVTGKVTLAPDGTIWVVNDELMPPPLISFDPRLAVRRTYGDDRTISPFSDRLPKDMPRKFTSALCFVFPEGASLCLFESES
jgi:hypothetical protein